MLYFSLFYHVLVVTKIKTLTRDKHILYYIGRLGVAKGTEASLKFKPIDKLTTPHERSRLDWSFDQV